MLAGRYCFIFLYLLHNGGCTVEAGFREQFNRNNDEDIKAGVACANTTAKRLFTVGRQIGILYRGGQVEGVEAAIVTALMKNEPIVIGNHRIRMKGRRLLSYIVIDYSDNFSYSREILLAGGRLRGLQYLFVTNSTRQIISNFSMTLWTQGFRNFAFSMLDSDRKWQVLQPRSDGETIHLKPLGYCNCTIRYAGIIDETVLFWRVEDNMRRKASTRLKTIASHILKGFAKTSGIKAVKTGNNYTWAEAAQQLLNGEIDVAFARVPDDASKMEGLEIICWYMDRTIVFAAQVKLRSPGNDILKMLMPFHFMVWVYTACLTFLYLLLVLALQKLAGRGLVRERLEFMQISAIMLAQGVTFPNKFALKLVLLLWMIFSLYLSIIYNSTFTSSLAQGDTEDLLASLADLQASGRPVTGPAMMRSYLNDSADPMIKKLAERYSVTKAPQDALDNIYDNNGVAAIQQFTVDRLNWEQRENRSLRLYTIPGSAMRFPIFMVTRKGHPYRHPLRLLITRYRGGGLIRKWINRYIIEKDKAVALQSPSDDILTMKHLQSIFQLLGICNGISCLIFLIELMHKFVPFNLFD